MLAYRRIGASV